MPALTIFLTVVGLLVIAYRYYSAFLAARVRVLDDSRPTPVHELHDGRNYFPTGRWVLFGYHFAALDGARPLIAATALFPGDDVAMRGAD